MTLAEASEIRRAHMTPIEFNEDQLALLADALVDQTLALQQWGLLRNGRGWARELARWLLKKRPDRIQRWLQAGSGELYPEVLYVGLHQLGYLDDEAYRQLTWDPDPDWGWS